MVCSDYDLIGELMQVEPAKWGSYKVMTGIVENADAFDVTITRKRGWKVVPPNFSDRSDPYLTPKQACALGRALILAADWCMEQNAKEKGE